ncbi:MAG: APC family permease [Alphaproteobacteria bacterium]|nr:APC family permease [Alphaproteobacteria bacterium]MBU1515931.1 APC family permease [Alphaproteobacteria bacterium]MBU2094153.1 APC family permease [Alphaproteobacteria bacterium]MBU2151505.1 APC family permease [Alphaproteobacteria bacterium]MBU2305219.1 APC family permease [Alphaproteobacteria bacterium]
MTVATPAAGRPHASRGELLRVLGLGFGIAVVVGGVVGQGILRTPGIVAGALHDPVWILLAWAAVGLFTLIDAFALVELGAAIPRAGGPYAFVERAFGRVPGAVVGWSDWFTNLFAVAFIAVAFAEFTQRFGVLPGAPTGALAVAVIGACWLVNWLGTSVSGLSQNIGSALKAIALLVIVGLCFAAPGPSIAAPALAAHPALTIAGVAIALRAILNTYSGWNTCAYFCEEVHAPEKNLARATFTGIAVVTGLYLLVNAGLLHALTVDQIAASNLPVADAVETVLGPAGGLVTTAFAMISVAAIANLVVMSVSRIAFGMARSGILPSVLAQVAPSGTPRAALLASVVIAGALASSGAYMSLMAIGATFAILVNIAVDLAALGLRRSEPDLPRPYRMPFFPLPPLAGIAINLVILIALLSEDPTNTLVGIVTPFVAALAYLAIHRLRPKL